jgi:hypothetical protein
MELLEDPARCAVIGRGKMLRVTDVIICQGNTTTLATEIDEGPDRRRRR